MQLVLERPDYAYSLRGADGRHALVNERSLTRSFIIAPHVLVEDWPIADIKAMRPADRQRGLLMIACGIIFIANVLIWTI